MWNLFLVSSPAHVYMCFMLIAVQITELCMFYYFRLPKPIFAKQLTQTDSDGIHEKDLERVPGIMK